jgi:hypothetical protein
VIESRPSRLVSKIIDNNRHPSTEIDILSTNGIVILSIVYSSDYCRWLQYFGEVPAESCYGLSYDWHVANNVECSFVILDCLEDYRREI